MSTTRFSDVVARSGRPKILLTWVAPATDRVLQTAIKQSRVLSVHQAARGARKDFGMVGFETGHEVQYLVFPRSLRPFLGQRVVGIRYELVNDALSSGAPSPVSSRPPAKPKPASARIGKLRTKPSITEKLARVRPPADSKPANEPIKFQRPEMDNDPVKAEIRRALTDLSKGHLAKVKQRLTALLRAP